jgi:hypothetical protein
MFPAEPGRGGEAEPQRLQRWLAGLPRPVGVLAGNDDRGLQVLDAAACRMHASREELVLALADEHDRRRFIKRHGVDPRSPASLLGGLLGG